MAVAVQRLTPWGERPGRPLHGLERALLETEAESKRAQALCAAQEAQVNPAVAGLLTSRQRRLRRFRDSLRSAWERRLVLAARRYSARLHLLIAQYHRRARQEALERALGLAGTPATDDAEQDPHESMLWPQVDLNLWPEEQWYLSAAIGDRAHGREQH